MKKIIVTLLFAGASLYSVAQAEFSIGLKAGPNFANLNTDESAGDNYKARTGFHVGAFALIKGEKVGFQPEVVFSQQGSKFKVGGNDIKSNFSYVNIPLIVKLYTIAGINLQVGPQIGFLTSAKDKSTISGISTTTDVKDEFKTTDFSLALGVGWDLPFGLSIDGRYNWGLTDNNDGYGSGASDASIKNQVWQFSLGYKFFKF
jgi:hypothetical protein